MVYACVMYGPARTVLLSLVLLMQGWGSAYAAKQPMLVVPTQAQAQEMPCHGQQAESTEQTAMPCCDADDHCACTASCFTNGNAVAPQPLMGSDYTAPRFSKPASPGHLLPAHPLGLLRPPTRQES